MAVGGSAILTIASTGNTEFNGNVGLNTSSFPANGKNLKISDSTISRLVLEKTGASARVFEFGASTGFLNVYDATADKERIRINDAGNVMVGEGDPSVDVHIKASATGDHTVRIEGTGTSGDTVLNLKGATNDWQIAAPNAASAYGLVIKQTGGSAALFINSSNNIGIGTSDPDAILHTSTNATDAVTLILKIELMQALRIKMVLFLH